MHIRSINFLAFAGYMGAQIGFWVVVVVFLRLFMAKSYIYPPSKRYKEFVGYTNLLSNKVSFLAERPF
jgi:hypothetical protein